MNTQRMNTQAFGEKRANGVCHNSLYGCLNYLKMQTNKDIAMGCFCMILPCLLKRIRKTKNFSVFLSTFDLKFKFNSLPHYSFIQYK